MIRRPHMLAVTVRTSSLMSRATSAYTLQWANYLTNFLRGMSGGRSWPEIRWRQWMVSGSCSCWCTNTCSACAYALIAQIATTVWTVNRAKACSAATQRQKVHLSHAWMLLSLLWKHRNQLVHCTLIRNASCSVCINTHRCGKFWPPFGGIGLDGCLASCATRPT